MQLTLSDNLLWVLGTALKLLLCFLVFYRGLYRRLPVFAFYAVLLLLEIWVVWWAYRRWGYLSRQAWYTYWFATATVIVVRTFVIAEICWKNLRIYPGIWSMIRNLLVLIAFVVFGYAVFEVFVAPLHAALLTAEQGLEILIVTIIVAWLGLGRRYEVPMGKIERNIVMGLGIYLAFQIINDAFMNRWMTQYVHWWNLTRQLSFDVALVIWIIPLWKPLPPLPKPPELFGERESRYWMLRMLVMMRRATRQIDRVRKSLRTGAKSRKR